MRVIRAGEHIQYIPGYGISVREGGVAVAAANWWEVPGKTCVAAYQPKGAASYAASKVNLANPGTYDAAEGVAPTWAAATGWTFNGTNQYLTCGITPTSVYTALMRMANLVTKDAWAFGNYSASGWGIQPTTAVSGAVSGTRYFNGRITVFINANRLAGVWGLVGAQGYFNGVTDGGLTSGDASPDAAIFIGDVSGVYRRYLQGDILAFVLYSATLTADEVATVSTAMSLL